jgi:hypothetical protein
VNFWVEVPADTPVGTQVNLNLLDEVTGLAINPSIHAMKVVDDRHFTISLPIRSKSVIKYRYSMAGSTTEFERTQSGEPVRYRLCQVTGPLSIKDTVSAWMNTPAETLIPTGSISGRVINSLSQAPIPGMLIAAGGYQVVSASDGSFLIDGLLEGTHNLVAYAVDGEFATFQQGARVSPGLTTPARISLSPANRVNVTFSVHAPQENVVGLPIRLAGNLLALGNTFADLPGGLSTIASRMPLLTQLPDGQYQLTLSLPTGAELEYKYTLGDGFWNSELSADGKYALRKLSIPDHDVTVTDEIVTWHTLGFFPVTFDLTAPANTPSGESVSIQFKPFGWAEPVPMWPLGDNHFLYILYNPLNFAGDLAYRLCRNDQCGNAEQAALAGAKSAQGSFSSKTEAQTIRLQFENWDFWQPTNVPTNITAASIQPRGADFMAGVEFSSAYDPTWQPFFPKAFQNLRSIGANWVVLTPSWSLSENSEPSFTQKPGKDILWNDLVSTIGNARNQGLKVALYPSINIPGGVFRWWKAGTRDTAWWDRWFARYQIFALHHADVAAQAGAGSLILGGEWLSPALPGGSLADGSPSGVPADAETRWRALLDTVRSHFSGKLLWAMNYLDQIQSPPTFLDSVDAIYLEFSPPFAENTGYTQDSLIANLESILDSDVAAFHNQISKPVILAPAYPSANGAGQACVPDPNGEQGVCQPFDNLGGGEFSAQVVTPNLEEQVDIYNAIFSAMNGRNWIAGLISRGYFPPVPLQDSTISVHGKPAMDILWYWFPKLVKPN